MSFPPLIFRGLDFRRFREPIRIPEPCALHRPCENPLGFDQQFAGSSLSICSLGIVT